MKTLNDARLCTKFTMTPRDVRKLIGAQYMPALVVAAILRESADEQPLTFEVGAVTSFNYKCLVVHLDGGRTLIEMGEITAEQSYALPIQIIEPKQEQQQ